MKGLDGLAFIAPALMLVVGLFAESAGEVAITVMIVIGSVGAVGALDGARYSFLIVMNFADDIGLKRGLPYAALWMLRAASAFWLWMALAFWALSLLHSDWRDVLMRTALMSASIGAIVFVLGVGWFIIYAWAKRQAHEPASK